MSPLQADAEADVAVAGAPDGSSEGLGWTSCSTKSSCGPKGATWAQVKYRVLLSPNSPHVG